MSKNKISFGAHMLSPPHLPIMLLEDAKYKMEKSQEIVEERLGKSGRHFAIPNGRSDDLQQNQGM